MNWKIELKNKYRDERSIILAWHNAEITEGQASKLLNLNRLDSRKLRDKYICIDHDEIKQETLPLDLSVKFVCEKCLFDELKSNK